MMDVADLRREYTRGGLHRADLPAEPLALFEKWLAQACEAKLTDPTAMVVGTVDADGQPWQRTVLLKHYDAEGMVRAVAQMQTQQTAVSAALQSYASIQKLSLLNYIS